jgi:hypothetical protein
MVISEMFEEKFRQWAQGKDATQARISIFENVRDIPYAVVPELINAEKYVDILTLNRGSCTPKHFLLGSMFQRLGVLVLYAVYPFRWGDRAEVLDDYPSELIRLAQEQPPSYHLACRVEINGRLVLVDATLDSPLRKANLPVNQHWDGFSDTVLAIEPRGEEELYHPSEAYLMQPRDYDENMLEFYNQLNRCLEDARRL